MEIIRILGIDPSLRNTGFAILEFNTETRHIVTSKCGVLKSAHAKFKGLDAVKDMLRQIADLASKEGFNTVDDIAVEFPMYFFNASFANAPLLSVAGIAGGAAIIFGIDKTLLVTPSEWNQRKKKEVTHKRIAATLGDIEEWNFLKKPAKGSFEHILDAAGIALWLLNTKYMS